MTDAKRPLDIEAALRWAYRDELPKSKVRERALEAPDYLAKPGEGWGSIESYAALLTRIDANRYGVVPDLWDLAEPHPDAILIGEAVRDLDAMELEIPEGWDPLGDLGDLGAAGAEAVRRVIAAETRVSPTGVRRLRTAPSVLVTKYALLRPGTCPEWECDVPEIRFVCANGKPRWFLRTLAWSQTVDGREVSHEVESDGYNARAKRPYAGAYRKTYLSPDPGLGILGRAEYEVWHAALGTLVEDLAPRLASIALAPFARSPRPWLDGPVPPPLAPSLDDLSAPLTEFRHPSAKISPRA